MKFTKKKLDEAEFFLIKMRDNVKKMPDFDYYVNAFVSASRSVTWIMNKECNKIEQYSNWKKSKIYSDLEEEILKQFTDWRNESIHQKPLETVTNLFTEFINLDDYQGDSKVFMKEYMNYLEEDDSSVEINYNPNGFEIKCKIPLEVMKKVNKILGRPYSIIKELKMPTKTIKIEEFRASKDLQSYNIIWLCEDYFRILNEFVNYISQKIKSLA